MRCLVLPGMDGGASLSAAFRAHLDDEHDVVAVEYPPDEPWDYARVETYVRARLEESRERTLLIAESFSGPVGIRIAADPTAGLAGVLLVATFARPPVWSGLRRAIVPGLFRVEVPRFAIRRFMLERASSDGAVRAAEAAIKRTDPLVMSARLRAILTVDVRDALRARKAPTIAVRALRDRMVAHTRCVTRDDPSLRAYAIDGPHLLLNTRPLELSSIARRFIEQEMSNEN